MWSTSGAATDFVTRLLSFKQGIGVHATQPMNHDIIVIGGGPAGSSAALRAAQLGARVLLLEKDPMPRPKLCGGWVSRYALSLLPFELPRDLIEVPFRSMELTDGTSRVTITPSVSLGVLVDRATFDQYLLEQARLAGAEVRWEKAIDVLPESSEIQVRTSDSRYTAGGVIICTGASGELVKTVRLPDTIHQSAACVEQRLSADFADLLNVGEGDGRFFFGGTACGFGWVLHHGSYLLVGIGQRRDLGSDLVANFTRFCDSLALPREVIHHTGHLVPLGGHSRKLGQGRCLLAGDAAGMVDAQNGEGIAGAIESGRLAAKALATGSSSNAAAAYSTLCEWSLLPHLRWSRRFAWGFYHSSRWALKALETIPHSLEQYMNVLERRQSYPRYLFWIITQRLLRLRSG